MPRLPRFNLPGYPLHVEQRGDNSNFRTALYIGLRGYLCYIV